MTLVIIAKKPTHKSTYEVCHEKTDLKVFVVVIPKVWYDTDFLEFESFDFIDHIP